MSQEHKILCLKHYFERICLSMPSGYVSFQRKVLPLEHPTASYPDTDFWSNSSVSLCPFEVRIYGIPLQLFMQGLACMFIFYILIVSFAFEKIMPYWFAFSLARSCALASLKISNEVPLK